MGILLDTGFLFSLKVSEDDRHTTAQHIFQDINWKKYGQIATSNLVVSELFTLVNIRTKFSKLALQQIEQLIWGKENFFEIIFLRGTEFQEITKLLLNYSDPNRLLSFVDASLIFLSQKKKSPTIVSFDKHFDGILTRISE